MTMVQKTLCKTKILVMETYSTSKAGFIKVVLQQREDVPEDSTATCVEGWGEFGGKDVGMTVALFHDRFAPALHEQVISSPFELFSVIASFELNYKMMGVQFSKALCGIDSAIWDGYAKLYKTSVSQLMRLCLMESAAKGSRLPTGRKELASQAQMSCPSPYPVYASSINREIDTESLISELQMLRNSHGITAFKVKIGDRMAGAKEGNCDEKSVKESVETVKSIYRALVRDETRAQNRHDESGAEECKLGVDCNGGFRSPDSIVQLQNELCQEGVKLWFVEEPFPWFHYEKYLSLTTTLLKTQDKSGRALLTSDSTKCLIAGGEQEFRKDLWELLFDSRDSDRVLPFEILQPDVGYCGGPSTALWIGQLANQRRLHFMPHSPQGDLMPIMSWHILCALDQPSREDNSSYLELGCVDDGLVQVKLDAKGEYETPYFLPRITVVDGKFTLQQPESSSRAQSSLQKMKGWGVQMKQDWLEAAKKRVYPDTNKSLLSSIRSGL